MNSQQATKARITQLEDKLAYTYQFFEEKHPGVRVNETGPVKDMWQELDFLYTVEDVDMEVDG